MYLAIQVKLTGLSTNLPAL